MSISLRIKQLIEEKKLNITSFEKKIGAGMNAIGTLITKNSNISGVLLSKILSTYPEVDANWLITGQGSMYKGEVQPAGPCELCSKKEARIQELEEMIAICKKLATNYETLYNEYKDNSQDYKKLYHNTQIQLENCEKRELKTSPQEQSKT